MGVTKKETKETRVKDGLQEGRDGQLSKLPFEKERDL